jgi:CPSF A subunit region
LQLFVVCTAYVLEHEPEPTKGRLMLLQLAGAPGAPKELKFLGETVLTGSCYQAQPLPNARGKIAATVNSRLVIFLVNANVQPGGGPWKAFELESKKSLSTIALFLSIHGDTLVVGDMMQSVAVFKYIPERQLLEQVAMEYECAHRAAS